MLYMRLDELVSRLEILRIYAPGRKGSGIPCCAVTAISCNSREIQRDAVFVAVKGAQTDGHAFIQDALRRGAGLLQDVLVMHEIRKAERWKSALLGAQDVTRPA